MPRKLSKEEIDATLHLLMTNSTEVMEWSQIYMVFRLMGEEEGVDKDVLNYNKAALIEKFNEILRKNVPAPEKRMKTFLEMSEKDFSEKVKADPLLNTLKKGDYIYHISRPDIEEKEHHITDLLYEPQGDNRFMLVCTLPELPVANRNWGIIDSNPVTTAVTETNPDGTVKTEVPHGAYRIWCFRCEELFIFELNGGEPVDKITCDKCHQTIIEKHTRQKVSGLP